MVAGTGAHLELGAFRIQSVPSAMPSWQRRQRRSDSSFSRDVVSLTYTASVQPVAVSSPAMTPPPLVVRLSHTALVESFLT